MGQYYDAEGKRVDQGDEKEMEDAKEYEWYEFAGTGDFDSSFGGMTTQYPKFQTEELGTREQKDLRAQYFQMLMGMQPATAYEGQFTQPTTAQEKTGMEALTEYLGRGTPEYFGDIEGSMTRALSGESPYEVDPTATSRYFEEYIKQPTMQTYIEELLPTLRESFAGGSKFWATPRLEAETGLAGKVSSGLSATRGKLAMRDIEAEEAGKTKGAELAAGTLPHVTALMNLLEGGGLRKAEAAQKYGYFPREETDLRAQYEDWLRVQNDKYKQAGLMQQALGLETTQPYMTPKRPGWLEGMGEVAGPIIGAMIGGM